MADRILIWHTEGKGDEPRIGPAYYLETDYEPLKVRIHAEVAPSDEDAEFDIRADGVSIFANQTPTPNAPAGRQTYITSNTGAVLAKGDTTEVDAEDFKEGLTLEEGSWLTCVPIRGGKGKNFTISLELDSIADETIE